MADSARTNELLAQIKDQNSARNKLLHQQVGIGSLLGAGAKTLEKLTAAVFQAIVGLDYLKVLNADINVNAKELQRKLFAQNLNVGKLVEHTDAALKLHRIGYKTLDGKFIENISLLNKQGNQGDKLIGFMAELGAKGADLKTQRRIAETILKMHENTATTANAQIAALGELDTLHPMLAAIGLQGTTLEFTAKALGDMPTHQAMAMGKALKEQLNPSDLRKSFALGGVEAGNNLLAALQKQDYDGFVRALHSGVEEMAENSKELMSAFGGDIVTLKKAIGIFGGEALATSIAAQNALHHQEEIGRAEKEQLDLRITSEEAYRGSMVQLIDNIQSLFSGTMLQFSHALEPIVKELTKFLIDWKGAGLAETLTDFGKFMRYNAQEWADAWESYRTSSFNAFLSGYVTFADLINPASYTVEDGIQKIAEQRYLESFLGNHSDKSKKGILNDERLQRKLNATAPGGRSDVSLRDLITGRTSEGKQLDTMTGWQGMSMAVSLAKGPVKEAVQTTLKMGLGVYGEKPSSVSPKMYPALWMGKIMGLAADLREGYQNLVNTNPSTKEEREDRKISLAEDQKRILEGIYSSLGMPSDIVT